MINEYKDINIETVDSEYEVQDVDYCTSGNNIDEVLEIGPDDVDIGNRVDFEVIDNEIEDSKCGSWM